MVIPMARWTALMGTTPCARALANEALSEQIREVFVASDATYGMPRVRAELTETGVVASRKRIARLMRDGGMRGVSRRRGYVVTTERNKRQRPAPDLVNRQFVASDINELWVADMTYIPTWAGFIYLAVVLDVYSRKVVGWAFGEHMMADLVVAALNMALHTRKPGSVIHHSDQGSPIHQPGLWQPLRISCFSLVRPSNNVPARYFWQPLRISCFSLE
ncbi:integrase-like protein [Simplicispira metamorpha]|uniref:Integrase-like protein n=1 Tax=Simplicispira metamorpha TaxID=80881 RepID=A0A4R2N5A3_9BURK|nr:integrase-like protein [Simplicispira metamorpha]